MEKILEFWFHTLTPADWYKKSDVLDAKIKEKFETTYYQVVAGETADCRDTASGRLAEIIVLDQFARNMFRGTRESFAADHLALALAQEAVRSGDDKRLDIAQRVFLYMPYMHSESVRVHEKALELFRETPNLVYEVKHKAIIDQFGRYPHRNEILGRLSTPQEIDWMKENSGF
ncbi:MAG: DUF924 domain-containing protein [Proteobacteria bacterium]|nr:DUF924 domain-containing protein [Pseudomonadota bacterium]